MLHVVEKFLAELEMQLLEKKVDLDISAEAKEWLAKNGYDEKYGARPLSRLIQEKIKRVLADEILFGRLEKGGSVAVGVSEDELSFDYTPRVHAPETAAELES